MPRRFYLIASSLPIRVKVDGNSHAYPFLPGETQLAERETTCRLFIPTVRAV